MNVDSRALADFLRANLKKVPTPAGYDAFREKVKTFKPLPDDRGAGDSADIGSGPTGQNPRR